MEKGAALDSVRGQGCVFFPFWGNRSESTYKAEAQLSDTASKCGVGLGSTRTKQDGKVGPRTPILAAPPITRRDVGGPPRNMIFVIGRLVWSADMCWIVLSSLSLASSPCCTLSAQCASQANAVFMAYLPTGKHVALYSTPLKHQGAKVQ